MSFTGIECLRGRHYRCRAENCACSVCGHGRVVAADLKPLPRKRPTRVRTVRVSRPGPKLGKGSQLGKSSLPTEMQAAIEAELRGGDSISAIARSHGVSRDKVRTIKARLLAQGESVVVATSGYWRTRAGELEAENAALLAEHERLNKFFGQIQ